MSHNDPNDGTYRDNPASPGGPDTVRILPDDGTPLEPENEWMAGPAPGSYRGAYAPVRPYDTQEHARQYAPTQAQSPAQNVTHVHKGPSGCAIVAATLGVVLLACVLLSFATLQDGLSGIGRVFQWPSIGFAFGTPTVTIDTSRPAIIDRVRALSRLETVHYQVEKVVTGESTGPLPEMFTGDKILLVAHGEVIAGVDLGKMEEGDVRVVSDTVTIRMPAAEILSFKLDNEKTYVYDRQTGFFSDPDPNLETEIRRAAEAKIVEASQEAGITEQAATNARQVLRSLLAGLGYDDVRFEDAPRRIPTGTPRATTVPTP